ncbi:hypothetical protein OS242_19100 [Tumebacillus sp. DT12]|uniref:Uncharacterized protein n=1 Tax=Tumebacillus lacus TaxID=2995335 RepID=A0ABT3X7T4_9BACL|nr:hypothetical protein [Tumebacillus lacus]MCX7572048.1 hypothetical protein [Tumebacillus lacus]
MEPYLLALGYGGDRKAAAAFEWEFRVRIGAERADDAAGREAFIEQFAAVTENGQEYAIPVEDPSADYVRTFGEYAKHALEEHADLFVFYILEDAMTEKQFKIYLKKDDPESILDDHQIYCDGFDVPRDGLVWMQEKVGCRFYITEDREEMMVEFPAKGPEELPMIQ